MIGNLSSRPLAFAAALTLFAGAAIFAVMVPFASAVGPVVTTEAATSISMTDATLNGMNGDADATATAFWVSTSTFTPVGGVSPTLPANVYSTGALPAVASSTAFSAQLSSATIPAGLLPITASTTYYFTAWSEVGGVWTPGDVVSFTTLPDAPTVTGISPTTGSIAGGTTVTITGTNLTGTTAVNFGGVASTGVVVNSDTSITAISPATTTAGTVHITVVTPGGTSTISAADQFTYTAPVVLAPVISNITVSNIGSTTATISWNTDVAANTQVSYGTTTSYGSNSTLDTTASTTHSANLTGLSEGMVYHFVVMSNNSAGTTTSADQTFVTQSTGSSTPLHVDSITPVKTSAIADNTFANGWSWTMRLTVPDNEDAFRMAFSQWSGSAGTFAAGNVRIYSAQSSNASTTSSALMSPDANYSGWMYLTGDAAASTPGRQIDVTIEVRIPLGTPAGSYTTNFTANSVPQTATSTTI